MIQAFYVLMIVCHLAILIYSFTHIKSNSWRIWLLRLLSAGVLLDNTTLLLSPQLLGTDLYMFLNRVRFAAHGLVLPFLTLFGLSILKESDIKLASNKIFIALCAIVTLGSLYFGITHDVFNLQLGEKVGMGYTRLADVGGSLPPIGTIVTNLLVMIMGIVLWRKAGWKWLFFGSLFIFVLNAATGAKEFGFMVGNAAEVVFVLSLYMTERWLTKRRA